jgi:type IV secretory pathway VirB4 component
MKERLLNVGLAPIIERALTDHKLLAKALFERSESLSALLPYDEYLPQFELFRQKDGSLGVIYAAELCQHETKTSQEIQSLLLRLKSWFKFSEGMTLSILFEQAPMSPLDEIWDRWKRETDLQRQDIPAKLHLAQLEKLRSSGNLMKRRLILSIRQFEQNRPIREKVKRLGAELSNADQTLSHELKDFLKRARSLNHTLSQFELDSPLKLRRITGEECVDFLRKTFNPVTYYKRPFAAVNPNLPLSEQVSYTSSRLDFSGIECEGIKTRTLSLKNAPSFAYPGGMAYFLSLKFPFRICLNIAFPSSAKIKRHFAMKDFFLQNTPSARSRRQKAEIDALQEKLLRDDHVLEMTFHVVLEADSDEKLDLYTKECLARFQGRLECEAIVESDVGLGLWMNTLPLAYHPIVNYSARRAVRILASDVVHFLPVFDTFTGTPNCQSLFVSREGGAVPFRLKTLGNSHMVAVLGDTGSGKSGQVIKLLLGELRDDVKPLIFVIDYKTSYGMVSKFIPSELTTFERGKPLPFSPFRGEMNEDKVRFLVHLLSSAIQLTSPGFEMESEHKTCMTQALKLASQTRAQTLGVQYRDGKLTRESTAESSVMSLDDVIAALGSLTGQNEFEKYGKQVDELSKKLRPFYSDGIYAPFFRSTEPEKNTSQVDLYVYDLDELASDPILQTLLTMSVVDDIRRKITSINGKERGGYVVVEELGMLGRNNPIVKEFIIDAEETFRKLGFFLIVLTANPRNYFDTPAGQAVWAGSDHILILSMKEDNVDYVAEKSNLLDEATIQVAKSLRTVRGRYADCLYVHKTKELSGVFQNIPSAEELWLMPTHLPDNLEAQKTLTRFDGNPIAAWEDLVRRYPQGTKDIVGAEVAK